MTQWLIARVRQIDGLWFVCSFGAAVLLLLGARLPLWEMELTAPQYPRGLDLVAYGTRLEGDLSEINSLNHYVGVAPIEPDEIFELRLFPFAVGALAGALAIGAVLARHRLLRLLVGLGVWGFAAGFLIDVQWWLYRTGHELDPHAPMRALVPDGFAARVLGETDIINFHTEARVAEGFWLIVAAAVLVSAMPPVIRFLVASWQNTGEVEAAVQERPISARAQKSA
jgi:copper chaperone NosL